MPLWETLFVKGLEKTLKTDVERGLSADEVKQRLAEYGPNALPEEKRPSLALTFLKQFHSPLIYLVSVAALLAVALGHTGDAIFIFVVLLVNTTVGFLQENKADRSFQELKKLEKVSARVRRDGQEQLMDAEQLVPGDAVILTAGDKVPADMRLTAAENLEVNEAIFTGEAFAVVKSARADNAHSDEIASAAPTAQPRNDDNRAERSNIALMGTTVEAGRGEGIVIATGIKTELGRLAQTLQKIPPAKTPLQKKLWRLSLMLGGIIVLLVLVVLAVGISRGQDIRELIVAATALAVSAIPAGLLPAFTVILVVGMRRILKEGGLARNLVTIETLGSVTTILTDKTGTLTKADMVVSHIFTTERELFADTKEGRGFLRNAKANGLESHVLALKIGALVSDAFIENPRESFEAWIIRGRPLERALVRAAAEAGIEQEALRKEMAPLGFLPFAASRRFSASLNKTAHGLRLFVMGAPELIIERAARYDRDHEALTLTPEKRGELMAKLERLGSEGLRVVAVAYRAFATQPERLPENLEALTFVGLVALRDPLRPDARETIRQAQEAGVKVMLVTGDYPSTASTVAKELGITEVQSRVTPEEKMKIAEELLANGEVVAMTGDGVNDAPALKRASVGVAMGSGTDVAKEASDVILLEDNLHILVSAIRQGRIIFENLRKVIWYLLADDFSEITVFLGALALGLPLPLLPAQILWINIVEDGLPDIALAFEPGEKGIMKEPPREPREPIFNRKMKMISLASFVIFGIGAGGAYLLFLHEYDSIEKVRTLLFTLIGLDSLLFAFSARSFRRPLWRRFFTNPFHLGAVLAGLGLLVAALTFPPLQRLLHTQPLTLSEWGLVSLIAGLEIISMEIAKRLVFRGKATPGRTRFSNA